MDLSNFTPFGAVAGLVGKVLDRVLPEDKAQKEAANLEVLKMVQSGELAQLIAQTDINKAEATNPNMFVAGWRPFVGWVCGMGLLSQFIIRPLATWIAALLGHAIIYPTLEMGTLMTLLGGMLGLGGMRTVEKLQDAEGNR